MKTKTFKHISKQLHNQVYKYNKHLKKSLKKPDVGIFIYGERIGIDQVMYILVFFYTLFTCIFNNNNY